MKKFLLVFFLIFSLSKSKAQVTYHFPHQNAEWGQFEGMWGNGFNGGTVFYFVDGDTSLNSNNYIKINRKAFWSLTDTFISRYTYLREDSTGKVFVFDGTEKLLYDMNSSVGDTIHVYSFFDLNSFSDVIVDSISSIQLGNETRKIFYLSTIYFNIGGGGGNNNSDPLIWIEGIGSNAGIFFPAGGVAVDEVFWLTCFTENDTLKYSSGPDCNLILGTIEIDKNFDFTIYPNPFTEDFQLSITGAETDVEVSIYNIIVQQQAHLTISQSKSIYQTLSLHNYSAGVYLVSITINGQRFMRKVVKS